jgi:hypothetical protein
MKFIIAALKPISNFKMLLKILLNFGIILKMTEVKIIDKIFLE